MLPRAFARFLILCFIGPLPGLATEFPMPLPGNDLVGEIQTARAHFEDTLSDIARANDLGYLEITEANPGVDPWLPREGLEVLLPTRYILPPGPREGIVVNLPELRIYYYPKGENRIITHPLGIGREGWSTPTGDTRIIRKAANPAWYPPESIRQEQAEQGTPLPSVVPAGPDNPLGEYALYLGLSGYLLHGTNKPWGVGMRVSHGCIRLYPEDIASLFPKVPVGTAVRIINEPYKLGWLDGRLYFEAHQPLTEERNDEGLDFSRLTEGVITALEASDLQPDWQALKSAALSHQGIPVPISTER